MIDDPGPHQLPMVSPAMALPQPWAEVGVSVVVPTYNELDNLAPLVGQLFSLDLPKLRVVVVDDNSPDGTGTLADEIAARHNLHSRERMTVIHRKGKDGIGRAHLDGMELCLARGDAYVVQMDADLSHPVSAIPQMLGTSLATGADLIIGSRYVVGGSVSDLWGAHRRLLSRGGNAYVNNMLQLRIRDTTAGFKLWNAQLLRSMQLDNVRTYGFGFQIEMNYRAHLLGAKIVEIPIHFEERASGSSKMSFAIQREALTLPFRLRRRQRSQGAEDLAGNVDSAARL